MIFRRVAVVASCALLGGCLAVYGFDDYDTDRPLPNDEAGAGAAASLPLVLDRPSPLVLHRGDQGNVVVAVERNGDRAEVVLTAEAPDGIAIGSATIAPDASTGILVVTTSATAPLGIVPVTIHARAMTTTLELAVVGATLDPSFGDAGIVVGAVGESFVGLTADATDRATVTVRTDPDTWAVYQEDTRGVLPKLTARAADDGDLVSVTSVGLTTVVASTTPNARTMHVSGFRSRLQRWVTDIDSQSLRAPHVVAFPSGTVRLVTTESDGVEEVGIDSRALDLTDGGTEEGTELVPDNVASVAAVAGSPDRALVCASTEVEGVGTVAIHGLRSDGTLDPAFADAGTWRKAGPGETDLSCVDIVVLGDRAIVLTRAESHDSALSLLFALATTGAPDDAFGDAGAVDLGDASAFGLATDARGHVLVAEQSGGVARVIALGADGRADATFGDATGVLVIPLPRSAARGVRVLSDGRILVAGSFDDGAGARWFVAAFRP